MRAIVAAWFGARSRSAARAGLLVFASLAVAGCNPPAIVNALSGSRRPTASAIAYGPDPVRRLDVYQPVPSTRPAPVVVFIYGGSWRVGDRGDYRFVGDALASRGVLAVLPDYRGYPAGVFPTFVEDAASAVAWAHAHASEFGGDPDRLFLMGHSAGAHIGSLLTLDAHYLDAVGVPRTAIAGMIGLAGPYRFKPRPRDLPAFGLTSTTQPVPDAIEPITFARGDAPPLLLIQGARDTTVRPDNATALADAVRAKGGQATVIEYSKQDHVRVVLALAHGFRWLAPTLDDSIRFIDAHPTTRP